MNQHKVYRLYFSKLELTDAKKKEIYKDPTLNVFLIDFTVH